jgi:ferrous iron transport protein B
VAKELVVSTLGVMYSQGAAVSETDAGTMSEDTQLQQALLSTVSLPAAVAFMVFVLLYFPCIATFVAIKNETNRWSWAIIICATTMVVAWIAAFVAYQIATLIV